MYVCVLVCMYKLNIVMPNNMLTECVSITLHCCSDKYMFCLISRIIFYHKFHSTSCIIWYYSIAPFIKQGFFCVTKLRPAMVIVYFGTLQFVVSLKSVNTIQTHVLKIISYKCLPHCTLKKKPSWKQFILTITKMKQQIGQKENPRGLIVQLYIKNIL